MWKVNVELMWFVENNSLMLNENIEKVVGGENHEGYY